MKEKLSTLLKVVAFFGVGITILYLVYHHQQNAYIEECSLKGIPESNCSLVDKVISDFKNAKYGYIYLAVGLFMLSNVFRALRWGLLLQPLGYKPKLANTLGATMIGYLLNLSIPRAGEIAKPASLSRTEGIPLDKTIGTIVIDRIADVICLGVVFLLVILFAKRDIWAYLEENASIGSKFSVFVEHPLIAGAIALASVLFVIYLWTKRGQLSENIILKKVVNFLKGIWEGVTSVYQMEQKWLFIIYSVLIWICYYSMNYAALLSLDSTTGLSIIEVLVVFLFGSLGIVIPSPGGMGSYHFLIQESLAMYNVSGPDAFSFANIFFFAVQFANILFGLVAIIGLPIYNRRFKVNSN